MAHTPPSIPKIDDETKAPGSATKPAEATPAAPSDSGARYTHSDPERARTLVSLLERAWPRIRTSMYYLRDR
jgi:hypothetical protein